MPGPLSSALSGLCALCAGPDKPNLVPSSKNTFEQVNDDHSGQPVNNFSQDKGVPSCHPDPRSVSDDTGTVPKVATEGFSRENFELSGFQVSEVAHLHASTAFSDVFRTTCQAPNDERQVSPVIFMSSEIFSNQCRPDPSSDSDAPQTGPTVPQRSLGN